MSTNEGRQLAGYLASLINELDSVQDVEASTGEMYAIEVRARVLAIAKLQQALSTLLDTPQRATIEDEPNPYVV